jgi:hypothetical protein
VTRQCQFERAIVALERDAALRLARIGEHAETPGFTSYTRARARPLAEACRREIEPSTLIRDPVARADPHEGPLTALIHDMTPGFGRATQHESIPPARCESPELDLALEECGTHAPTRERITTVAERALGALTAEAHAL